MAGLVTLTEIEAIRGRIIALPSVPERPRLKGDDLLAALGIFLIVVAATFPVVLPFVLFADVGTAKNVSRIIALGNQVVGVGEQIRIKSRFSPYIRGFYSRVSEGQRNGVDDSSHPQGDLLLHASLHVPGGLRKGFDASHATYTRLSENVQPMSGNIKHRPAQSR